MSTAEAVLSSLSPDTWKLLGDHPKEIVRMISMLEPLRPTREEAEKLLKVPAEEWQRLFDIARTDEVVVRGAKEAWARGDLSLAADVQSRAKEKVGEGALWMTFIGSTITFALGLVVAMVGLLAAIPTGGVALAPAILGLIIAYLGGIAFVGSILGLIAFYLPDDPTISPVGTQLFGGSGGTAFVDEIQDVCRVTRIRVWSGSMVDGVQLSWETRDGAARDGARHGGTGGSLHELSLDPDERITKIGGRSGSRVDRISFFTSKGRVLGPFGGDGGSEFTLEPEYSDHIVGLHGRSGTLLDALGVCSGTFGSPLYGGTGGSPFLDDLSDAREIRKIVVRHGTYIDAIQVYWADAGGHSAQGVRHGGAGGGETTIELAAGERITSLGGRCGSLLDQLSITTTRKTYGPFGGGGGSAFEYKVPEGDAVIGFWGRSGSYLDALGICVRRASGA